MRDGSGENGGGRGELHLAVFGKHPGWNDHIDDQGVETTELAELKRQLYLDGVGGNIDAGTWDDDEASGGPREFAHVFLARRRGSVIGGRMWASVDGKGRSRYPMIVCIQVPESRLSWLCTEGLLRLEDLEEEFKAETDAAGVIAAADRSRSDLRARLAEATQASSTGATATGRLADAEPLGPERRGMHRLLYQLEREASAFVTWRAGSIAVDEARAQVVRVPKVGATDDEALELWMRFCQEHLRGAASVLLVSPRNYGWVDVVIGGAGTGELACLLSGTGTLPLVTEIPYTIEDAFREEADALIDRETVEVERVEPASRVELKSAVEKLSRAARGGGGPPVKLIVGGGLVAVALLAVLMLLISSFAGGGGKDSDEPADDRASDPPADGSGSKSSSTPKTTPGASDPSTPVSFGDSERAAWSRWCTAYGGWIVPVAEASRDSDLAGDDYLGSAFFVPLRASLDTLDPRRATRASVRSIERLASQPPSDVQTVAGLARIDEALAVIDDLRGALGPDAWPTRRDALRLAEAFEHRGAAVLAAELQEASDAIDFDDGAALLDAMRRLERRVEVAAALDQPLATGERAVAVLRRSGDPIADAAEGVIEDAAQRVQSLDQPDALAILETAGRRVEAIERAAAFVNADWERVDVEALRASTEWSALRARDADASLFRDWQALASEDRFRMLPAEDDPRVGWDVRGEADALRARLEGLLANASNEQTRVALGALAESVDRLVRDVEGIEGLRWTVASRGRVETGVARIDDEVAQLARSVERSERAAAASFAEYVQSVRDADAVARSAALNAIWVRERDALLARHSEPGERHTLQDGIERLEESLRSIDAAFARIDALGEMPAIVDGGFVRGLFADRREAAIAELGGEWSGGGVDPERVAEAADAFDAWVASVRASASAAEEVSTRLRIGEPAGDASDAGSVRAAFDRLGSAEGGWSAAELSPEVGARLEAIARIESAATPAEVVGLGRSAEEPEAALAAWRRLASWEDWPRDAADLRSAGTVLEEVRSRSAGLLPAYFGEVEERAARMWVSAAAAARTPEELGVIAGERARYGGDPEQLEPHTRVNLIVADFADWAAGAGQRAEDDAIRSRASETAAQVRALMPGGSAEVDPWLARLDGIATEDPDAGPEIDLSEFGPGKVGWSAYPSDDLSRVRFRSPGGGGALEFVRVDPEAADPGTSTVFLSRHELSVGVLASIVGDDPSRWEELALAWLDLESAQDGTAGSWRGPRSWVWDPRAGSLRASDQWIASEGGRVPVYPEGGVPPGPTDDSPVVSISARAADRVAQWAGCRLPTDAEWSRAAEQYGAGSATPNYRDQAWGVQQAHHRALEADRRKAVWPDVGVFRPEGFGGETGRDAEAGSGSDGVLWFEPVGGREDGGRGLVHLFGNAGEFVRTGVHGFGVIGGSALSDPEWPRDQALAVPERSWRSGFADVGVRLAFSVPGLDVRAPLRFRVARAGASAPFLTE